VERSEYEKLDIAEDRMWWFAAMHRNLLLAAGRVPIPAGNLPILDAGCGTDFLRGWRGNTAIRRFLGLNLTIMLAFVRRRKAPGRSVRDR